MTRSPALAWAAAAALAACPAAAARAQAGGAVAPPLAWADPGPLGRLFLQPAFEAPEVVAPGTFVVDLRLLYSNSLLVERAGEAGAEIDLETAQLTAAVRWGVAPGVELQGGLPFLVDYGGFLDGPIDSVEGWIGVPNPERRSRPAGAVTYRLAAAGAGTDRAGAAAGVGDAWLAAKLRVADASGAWPALSIRPALKLPTGRATLGSREVDLGASVHLGWTPGSVGLRLQLDVAFPTGRLAWAGMETHPYVGGQAGVAWQAWDGVALHLQAAAHGSPLTATGLRVADRGTAYLLAGATMRLRGASALEVGLAENLFAPENQGADFTLLVSVRAGP